MPKVTEGFALNLPHLKIAMSWYVDVSAQILFKHTFSPSQPWLVGLEESQNNIEVNMSVAGANVRFWGRNIYV